jgi:poly(3-hydroxybutyrate) depolymerase
VIVTSSLRTLAFTMALLMPPHAAAQSTMATGFLDRAITLNGHTYRYQVYVPAEWTKEKKWPVITFLHGVGLRGTDGLSHTDVNSLANAIRRDRASFPAIAVLPQARPDMRWSTPEMQDVVMAAVDRAVQEFNGDADRVYLTGFSMGGQGVLRIGSLWPDKFAALVAIAGRITPESDGRSDDEERTDVQRHPFLMPDPYLGTAIKIRQLPVRIYHGDADARIPVEESRRMASALQQLGANATYIERAGIGHDVNGFLADGELWAWLFAQRPHPSTVSQPPEMDPVKLAPDTYRVLLENDRVRVIHEVMRPGAVPPRHSHPDRVVIHLTPCTFPDRRRSFGETRWLNAHTHGGEAPLANTSECEVTSVELKGK